MIGPETLDPFIAGLYRAGSGVDSWPSALDRLAGALDLWGVQVVGVDKRTGTLMFSHESERTRPETAIDYIRDYHHRNPRMAPAMALSGDQWMHCHEHFNDEFVRGSAFYQDFLIPHGGRYLSATKLIDDDRFVVMFGAFRGVGAKPLGAAEVEAFERLRAHFRGALQIYSELREVQLEAAAGRHMLDRLGRPILVIDEQRGIRHANAAAMRLLAESPLLRRDGPYLRCVRRPDDERLVELVHRQLSPGHADSLAQRQVLRLKRSPGEPPVLLFLIRLRPVESMHVLGRVPVAIVIYHEAGQSIEIDPLVIGEAFDLTPAEARVAAMLAQGITPDAIAQGRQVAGATVRTQIRSVYAKLGITRQADLIRYLVELPAI